MRMAVRLVIAVVAVMVAPIAARSQMISGVVRDSGSSAALPGVVVSVGGGASVFRTTTDTAGRFALPRAAAGSRLRVLRIGYRPLDVALPASTRDTTVSLLLRRIPPLLESVRVADQVLCPGSTDRGLAFQLWEQARAGLLAAVVSREVSAATSSTMLFRRRLAPNDETVRDQSQEKRTGDVARPFATELSAAVLTRDGFMREDPTGRTFYGPDADVLLDETFAATHCFQLHADSTRPGQVGLQFQPAPRRESLVDVSGTIWMDAAMPALRSVEFLFTGLEPAAMRARPGGRLEFRTMPNGISMPIFWSLRIPALARIGGIEGFLRSPLVRARRERDDVRLREIEEVGGEVLEMSWRDGTTFNAASTDIVGEIVYAGTNRQVPFALVTREGARDTIRADRAGRFRFNGLAPGRHTVVAIDTLLGAYAEVRQATATDVFRRGETSSIRLTMTDPSAAIARACDRTSAAPNGADLFGRIVLPLVPEGTRLRVRAEWRADGDSVISDRYAEVDDRGQFRLCASARGRPVTLHAAAGDLRADTTIVADDVFLGSIDWKPTLTVVTGPALRWIRGAVVDSGKRPIADVTIAVRGTRSAITNAAGRFRVQVDARSATTIDARRVGLTPVLLALGPGDDTSVAITMLPFAQRLAPVGVTETRTTSALLRGFDDRRARRVRGTGVGHFFTAADIERRNIVHVTSLLADLPGFRVGGPTSDMIAVNGTSRGDGSRCEATVFVNGVRMPDSRINQYISSMDVAGIEAYSSATTAPLQYQPVYGTCAVVLIWTKGGG